MTSRPKRGPQRRRVLAGLTGLSALGATTGAVPLLAQSLPSAPDVVIVGAGAAGLAAGRELRKSGLSFVIIEAAARVGGRAYTESHTLGQPVDHGCSWINDSGNNPFTSIANAGGFSLVNHTGAGQDLFNIHGNRATSRDAAAFDRAWGATSRAIERAGRAGQDVSAASVAPNMPWGATVHSWIGPMDYGVDFDALSAISYATDAPSQPSYLVREGLGSVVATLADGLPVKLNTKAQNIDWSAQGVRVETSQGTIRAKACLVTVSTGVLNAGSVAFAPALPAWKQEAIADIPMGLLLKVPLLFDGARLSLGENNWVTYQLPESDAGKGCFFVAWPAELDYVMGFMGGSFAWNIYAQGKKAVVDFALEELVRLVGSDARKHFIKGFAADWADNPLTLGAYSAVRPGKAGAREKLAEPLGERVFFAGEAAAGRVSALVNGAYLSGKTTAQKIATILS